MWCDDEGSYFIYHFESSNTRDSEITAVDPGRHRGNLTLTLSKIAYTIDIP